MLRQHCPHQADIDARVILCAPLPHYNVARDAMLASIQLDSQHLWVGVFGILSGATLLFGRPAYGGVHIKRLRIPC